MSTFKEILDNFKPLKERTEKSIELLETLRGEFQKDSFFKGKNITIFAAGSIGRLECGKTSDLDLFLISKEIIKRLDEIKIYAIILNINERLNFPDLSNDGQFLQIHSLEDLTNIIGSPSDDYKNLFTTRMLLLLESNFLCNESLYHEFLKDIISYYFRDGRGKKDFRPLFLLNDLLRYWRTLCLNYEQTRYDRNRPWRKKNISLKFSRMLTVFGTVLPIISKPITSSEDVYELCKMRPLDRIAYGLDYLKNADVLKHQFYNFLQNYEDFLLAKENYNLEINIETKHDLDRKATIFSDFLFSALFDESLKDNYLKIDLRKYLVL